MSSPLRRSFACLRAAPVLVLFGTFLASLELVIIVGFGAVAADAVGWRLEPYVLGIVTPLVAGSLWYVISVPLLSALYRPARRVLVDGASVGFRDSFAGGRASAADAVRLLVAVVVTLGVAFALAIPVWFVLATAGLVALTGASALGVQEAANPQLFWLGLAATGLVSVHVARLLLRPFDVLVLFADERPARAWLTAARYARSNPRVIARYGLVVVGLIGGARLVALLVSSVSGVVAVGTYVLLGGIAYALFAAYHVGVFESRIGSLGSTDTRSTRTIDGSLPPVIRNPVRVAVAILLVTSLFAGTLTVRAADAGPTVQPDEPGAVDGSVEPAALIEANEAYLAEASVRVDNRVYDRDNETDERYHAGGAMTAVDRENRQVRVAIHGTDGPSGEQTELGGYFASGTIAQRIAGDGVGATDRQDEQFGPFQRTAGSWYVIAGSGYWTVADDVHDGWLPGTDADYDVTVDDDEVTFTADGSAYLDASPEFDSLDHDRIEPGDDVHQTVVVDRETGLITRMEERRNVTVYRSADREEVEWETDTLVETEFTEHGTATVDRPEEIGDRSLGEWLWAVANY